ncbi:MAG: MbnP family protein [Flavobacteriales bacterium]
MEKVLHIVLVILISLSVSPIVSAQGIEVNQVKFVFTINEKPLNLNESTFSTYLGDTISIDKLKFYISFDLSSQKDQSYFLIDASIPTSLTHQISSAKNLNELSFNLGVDSITNSSGAKGGDLDPMHGMYWSWQSGYINFKLEGSYLANGDKKKFTYHLGGYNGAFDSLQSVNLESETESHSYTISMSIDKLVGQFDYRNTRNLMSPSLDAVRLSKIVAKSFYLVN